MKATISDVRSWGENYLKIANKAERLEKQITGADGRPAFKADEVLDFMFDNSLNDPEEAYNLKHREELASAKIEPITKDNLEEKVKAVLFGEEGEKAE